MGKILVARCVEFHGLANVLKEPEDDVEITQILRKVCELHLNMGYRCAVDQLRTKGVKVK